MLSEEFFKLRDSAIQRLICKNEVLGYRVKYYDMANRKYIYVDFNISQFDEMPEKALNHIKEYFGSNEYKFENVELLEFEDNFMSQEEIDGNIVCTEIEDVKTIFKYVQAIINIKTKGGE